MVVLPTWPDSQPVTEAILALAPRNSPPDEPVSVACSSSLPEVLDVSPALDIPAGSATPVPVALSVQATDPSMPTSTVEVTCIPEGMTEDDAVSVSCCIDQGSRPRGEAELAARSIAFPGTDPGSRNRSQVTVRVLHVRVAAAAGPFTITAEGAPMEEGSHLPFDTPLFVQGGTQSGARPLFSIAPLLPPTEDVAFRCTLTVTFSPLPSATFATPPCDK